MATLKYSDLMAEAKREIRENSLEFIAKNGEKVIFRPVMYLSDAELKVIQVHLKIVSNEDADVSDRIEAIDRILVAAADRKKALRESLADLPAQSRAKIFETWMKVDDAGEASNSES
ncbi:hypothetical protein ACFVH6_25715 [Spirillospora sp. NPDC127200]